MSVQQASCGQQGGNKPAFGRTNNMARGANLQQSNVKLSNFNVVPSKVIDSSIPSQFNISQFAPPPKRSTSTLPQPVNMMAKPVMEANKPKLKVTNHRAVSSNVAQANSSVFDSTPLQNLMQNRSNIMKNVMLKNQIGSLVKDEDVLDRVSKKVTLQTMFDKFTISGLNNNTELKLKEDYMDNIVAKQVRAPRAGLTRMMAHSDDVQPESSAAQENNGSKVVRSMMCLMLAGALVLTQADPVFAARSGGRIGGRSPGARSSVSHRTSAIDRSNARSANFGSRGYNTTNNYVFGVSPRGYAMSPFPYGGGFGYGYGGGMFGYGYNPSLTIGLTVTDAILREGQRQSYLQRELETQRELGQDQAKIAALQQELTQQNSRIDNLNQLKTEKGEKFTMDEQVQKIVEQKLEQRDAQKGQLEILEKEYAQDIKDGKFVEAGALKTKAEIILNTPARELAPAY